MRPGTLHPAAEVLQGLADGKKLAEVAAARGIAANNLTAKLYEWREMYSVRTTHQLIAHFLRNGWID